MVRRFVLLKMTSAALSEVAMALYLLLIFSFYGNLGGMNMIESLAIGLVFMVLAPVSAVWIFYKQVVLELGLISREKRPKFYLVNILSFSAASLIFNYFNNVTLLEISLSFTLTMAVLFLINFKWKISLHGAGIGIACTALYLTFGLISLISLVLIPIIYWIRLKLRAHDIYQLLSGTFLGFIVTYGVFLSI